MRPGGKKPPLAFRSGFSPAHFTTLAISAH